MTAFAFEMVRVNGSALLPGCSSPSADQRETIKPIGSDGTLHQTGAAVIRRAPKIAFQTIAVISAFTLLGTGDEVPYVALDGSSGIEAIGAAINSSAPGFSGSSIHASRKMISGALLLASLDWSPGDVARVGLEAFGTSANGSTAAMASSTIAAPTLATNTEQLVVSAVTVTGTSLTRVASLALAVTHQVENNDEETCYSLGLVEPVLLKQPGVGGQTEIVLTIETLDLTTAITANGTVTVVLTKVNNLGVGYGANTATITLNNCIVREESISGGGGRAAKRRLVCRATYDGISKPLTLATA
jgi:hypothetical protein